MPEQLDPQPPCADPQRDQGEVASQGLHPPAPTPVSSPPGDHAGSLEHDRPDPRKPASALVIMRQQWRELLFLHWTVEPESVQRLLPPPLEVDLYEGAAYVGLVLFTMRGVRPVGFPPVPGLSDFHETNVRTYVTFGGREPGVWFFSLDAANSVAVWLARAWFHLPYHRAGMFLERETIGEAGSGQIASLLYAGNRRWPGPIPASYLIRAELTGPPRPADPGSLLEFLAERYVLYAMGKRHLYQGRVHHDPYPLQDAVVTTLDENLIAAAGLLRPDSPPLAHFSAGVDVRIEPLRRVARLNGTAPAGPPDRPSSKRMAGSR
jgi:uncharacterized protein YqjF (DUF2071 family)